MKQQPRTRQEEFKQLIDKKLDAEFQRIRTALYTTTDAHDVMMRVSQSQPLFKQKLVYMARLDIAMLLAKYLADNDFVGNAVDFERWFYGSSSN